MPKGRMTALDVRAMVSDISPALKRLRVANVYDISSKVYVLKLSEADTKQHLVLEAGSRFHLSEWKRDKQSIPSVFTMRLRKFLRTKRLVSLNQLGADRVIDMQFGLADNAMHLIVEFYARGNVVLTDHEYVVKATWRQFKGDDSLAVKVSQKYPIDEYLKETNFISVGLEAIKQRNDQVILDYLRPQITTELEKIKNDPKRQKKNASDQVPLSFLVAKVMPVAHQKLIDQILEELNIQGAYNTDTLESSLPHLYAAVDKLQAIWKSVSLPGTLGGPPEDSPISCPKGYLYSNRSAPEAPLINEEYVPLPIKAKEGWEVKEFPTFHQSVDEFYSSQDLQKLEKAQGEKVGELESRIEKIRRDQTERVAKLQFERDERERQASAVERNLDFVSKALEMVKLAVDTGSDWKMIEKMVKEQRKLGHPIATYIQKMDLRNRKFTLLVSEVPQWLDDEAEADGDDLGLVPVEVNVDLSAFANVESLHAEKKAANAKFLKTEEAAKRVIAAAEVAADKERHRKAIQVETRPPIQRLRKVFWFEKFHWFISSDNYLVLAGHDATQNDILYRKYLRRNDIYVHAEVHGAASCIIRNTSGGTVPQKTIDEAGQMSVCRSNAWKTKVLVQAYWVFAHQVSKTPQPGEYVSTGGFIIRGKRNPILVKKLEMGIGLVFHLGDEESVMRHIHEDDDIDGKNTPLMDDSVAAADDSVAAADSVIADDSVAAAAADESISAAGDESVGAGADESLIEESAPLRRPSLRKEGSTSKDQPSLRAVQFGAIHVMPTPTIQPRVDFDDLPPEVIVVHSERSILSDDDDHMLLSGHTKNCEEDDDSSLAISLPKRSFDMRRPDSADELSPPALYRGKAAPKELLAHRTPETMAVESEEGEVDPNPPEYTLESFSRSSPLFSSSSSRRSRVVDGGPLPRGFLEDEVPLPKTLLQLGSKLSGPSPDDDEEEEEAREEEVAPEEEAREEEAPTNLTAKFEEGKKGGKISRAERRRLRRGDLPSEGGSSPSKTSPVKAKEDTAKDTSPTKSLSRAKLKKMKKMKERYQDQSEEEREIALRLTGGKKLKEEMPSEEAPVKKENTTPWNPPPQHKMPDRNLAEEGSDEEDEEWKQKRQDQLRELTGRPSSKDTILFAMPVCAPYSAIQSYTYKGKLTPGGGKKGTAVNLIHRAFVEMSPVNSIQRQLVKAITSDELSAVLVASPVVSIQGGDKIQKQERRERKAFSKAVSSAAKV